MTNTNLPPVLRQAYAIQDAARTIMLQQERGIGPKIDAIFPTVPLSGSEQGVRQAVRALAVNPQRTDR